MGDWGLNPGQLCETNVLPTVILPLISLVGTQLTVTILMITNPHPGGERQLKYMIFLILLAMDK